MLHEAIPFLIVWPNITNRYGSRKRLVPTWRVLVCKQFGAPYEVDHAIALDMHCFTSDRNILTCAISVNLGQLAAAASEQEEAGVTK